MARFAVNYLVLLISTHDRPYLKSYVRLKMQCLNSFLVLEKHGLVGVVEKLSGNCPVESAILCTKIKLRSCTSDFKSGNTRDLKINFAVAKTKF